MESDPDFNWRPLDAPGDSTPAEPGQAETPPPAGESQPPGEQHLNPDQVRGAVALAQPPPPGPGDYEDFDVDDVPPPKGRGPASTRYLGIAILVAIGFVSGVALQKHHDAGYTPPAKGLAALAGAGGGGAGAAAGRGAAGAGAGAGAAAGGGAAGAAGGASRAPALTGSVVKVSGSDVTVRDTSGIVHVVHTNESTRVSRQESLTDLTDGANVSVQGQPDQSGGIAATAITEHPGGNPTPPPPGASGNASGAAPSGTTSSARTQAAPPGQ